MAIRPRPTAATWLEGLLQQQDERAADQRGDDDDREQPRREVAVVAVVPLAGGRLRLGHARARWPRARWPRAYRSRAYLLGARRMGRDGGRPVRGLRDRASGVGGGRPRGPRDRGLLGSRRRGRYAQIGRSLRERLAPEVRLFPGRQPLGLMPQEPFGDLGVLVPRQDGLGVARPSVAAVSRFRGPAVGGLSRPPQVTVAARGLGLGLAPLQPGELLGRSGFVGSGFGGSGFGGSGFGGSGKAGERRVERPAVADS